MIEEDVTKTGFRWSTLVILRVITIFLRHQVARQR